MKQETLVNKEQDPALEMLKSEALSLNGLVLADGKNLSDLDIEPGNYAENQGVIVFAIGDRKYAMPSSERSKKFLEGAELARKEAGVPNLNDAEVWGTPERRSQMESFRKWQELSQRQ